jgi:hypothetical protein
VIKHQFPDLSGWVNINGIDRRVRSFIRWPQVWSIQPEQSAAGLIPVYLPGKSRNAMSNRMQECDCYRKIFPAFLKE